MKKSESLALGLLLSDYPEEWTYKQIIDELKDGDNGAMITCYYLYDGVPEEDLAILIEDTVSTIENVYGGE